MILTCISCVTHVHHKWCVWSQCPPSSSWGGQTNNRLILFLFYLIIRCIVLAHRGDRIKWTPTQKPILLFYNSLSLPFKLTSINLLICILQQAPTRQGLRGQHRQLQFLPICLWLRYGTSLLNFKKAPELNNQKALETLMQCSVL